MTFASASAVPMAAAFDPANNDVYVTDHALNQVYVFSNSTLVKTIPSGKLHNFTGPLGIAFDPGGPFNGPNMVVANNASDNVTFVGSDFSQPNLIAAKLAVGSNPAFVAYDPHDDAVWVTNFGSKNVSVFSATCPFTSFANPFTCTPYEHTFAVGLGPLGVAFDLKAGQSVVAVANSGSMNVTFLSAFCHAGDLKVGIDPQGVVSDELTQNFYVVNRNPNSVSVVIPFIVVRTMVGPAGSHFTGIAYDEATDQVYVTAFSTDKVFVYS